MDANDVFEPNDIRKFGIPVTSDVGRTECNQFYNRNLRK
jgi:hypothetical protein